MVKFQAVLGACMQVKGLAFNQLSPNLLASGGADGDIIIWDVANPRKPTAFPPLKVITVTTCSQNAITLQRSIIQCGQVEGQHQSILHVLLEVSHVDHACIHLYLLVS